jgi:hypothetical protein
LQILQVREALEQGGVGCRDVLKLAADIFRSADWDSKHFDASTGWRDCNVSGPRVWGQVRAVGWREAAGIPNAGFALVKLDVRMGGQIVGQGIQHWHDSEAGTTA